MLIAAFSLDGQRQKRAGSGTPIVIGIELRSRAGYAPQTRRGFPRAG